MGAYRLRVSRIVVPCCHAASAHCFLPRVSGRALLQLINFAFKLCTESLGAAPQRHQALLLQCMCGQKQGISFSFLIKLFAAIIARGGLFCSPTFELPSGFVPCRTTRSRSRPREPAWHREARRGRTEARTLLRAANSGWICPTELQRASQALQGHHSNSVLVQGSMANPWRCPWRCPWCKQKCRASATARAVPLTGAMQALINRHRYS